MSLDNIDKKIIQLMGADARMSNHQMAAVIGVSEGTVRNRVKKLINNEVIKILQDLGFGIKKKNFKVSTYKFMDC